MIFASLLKIGRYRQAVSNFHSSTTPENNFDFKMLALFISTLFILGAISLFVLNLHYNIFNFFCRKYRAEDNFLSKSMQRQPGFMNDAELKVRMQWQF